MAGHTRKNNMFVCPSGSTERSPLPSPPDSPPPKYEFDGFQLPPGDRWHWRNPNWVSPPRERPHEHTLTHTDRNESLTPTEPLSNNGQSKEIVSAFVVDRSSAADHPVDEWADHPDALHHYPKFLTKVDEESPEFDIYMGCSDSPREWSPFSQSPITDISLTTALRAGTPLYSVYRVPREDVPKIERTAQREGKLFSVMKAPPAHFAKIPHDKSRETVWVILSDREEDLRYAVHSQRMPGALAQGSSAYFDPPRGNEAALVMQNAPFCSVMNQPTAQHVSHTATFDQSMYMPCGSAVHGQLQTGGHGFLQMAFAGIIGGLIVIYGRALL